MTVYVMTEHDFQSSDPEVTLGVTSDIEKGKNYLIERYHNKDGKGFFESREEAEEAVKTRNYTSVYIWVDRFNYYSEHYFIDKQIYPYHEGDIQFKPFDIID